MNLTKWFFTAAVFSLFANVASAVTIFSDDFNSYTLGTTWAALEGTPGWFATTFDGRSALQMDASGSANLTIITSPAIATPTSTYGDLTATAYFAPTAAGSPPYPFEVIFGGSGGSVRTFFFFTAGAGNIWSDGTGMSQIQQGSYSVSSSDPTWYRAVFNTTSLGTSVQVFNDDTNTLLHTNNSTLTRANYGNSVNLLLRQANLVGNQAYADLVTVEGVVVPEPSSLAMLAFVGLVLGCVKRRRR